MSKRATRLTGGAGARVILAALQGPSGDKVLIHKFLQHYQRIRRARRFGVPFVRRAWFKVPHEILLCGRKHSIVFPCEIGTANDFLTCFIEDDYGLSDFNAPVETILDIGANVGFFSLAARAYFPNSIIHAYEPNPRVLNFLCANSNVGSFEVFAEAMGSKEGYVLIDDQFDSNQARTRLDTTGTARIKQTPLSTAVERLGGRVDLAKIDCEGAEWDLFTASEPWGAIRLVRMEYHLWGIHTFDEVVSALRKLDFEITRHRPSGEWGTLWCRNTKAP